MTDLDKILLTSGLTIIVGVFVFVVGQLVNEIVIKPYIQYKKIIGEIDEELIFSSNIYTNAGINGNSTRYREASLRLRHLSSNFSSTYRMLSLKNFFIALGKVVNKENKDKIEGNLFFLSSSLFDIKDIKHNKKASKEIREILKI